MAPNYRWLFELAGPFKPWFTDLSRELSDSEFRIQNYDDFDDNSSSLYWTSPHLQGCPDKGTAIQKALALKALFDGAIYLYMKSSQFQGTYFLRGLDEKTSHSFSIEEEYSLAEPFDSTIAQRESQRINTGLAGFIALSSRLARKSDTCRNILSFVGVNGITWISLYAIRDFLKDPTIRTLTGASKNEIDRFRRTANSFSVLGPKGRHGSSKEQPPPKPMKLTEAENLICEAAIAYFRREENAFKANISLP
jgi:hypothetical protein